MSFRKLPASDGGYLIARHPQYGFVLIDPARHVAPRGAPRPAYSLQDLGEILVPSEDLWVGASDDLSDGDLNLVIYYYERFKQSLPRARAGPGRTASGIRGKARSNGA